MRQLVNWFRRKQMDRDLDRELQYHLDRRITDLKNSGLPAQAARKRAMQELGGIVQTQEEVRDIWLRWWLTDFLYDFRFSLRSFLRTPSFTITAVLSLTLGIGASTAIYSLVDQIVLHALPVREPERLVLFDWDGDWVGNGFGSWNLMPYPVCRDLDQKKQFFEGVFCRALTPVDLSIGSDTSPVTAEIVSGNYFPVLGVSAAVGQVITTDGSCAECCDCHFVRCLADASGRGVRCRWPQAAGQWPSTDHRRRGCYDISRHRRGGSAGTLDPGLDVDCNRSGSQ